ncbi:MAG: hypothetical protein HY904_05250 [Deltaproteobacteria bacterium]|nr:hypothetical protein [Deltaproteobacteria bacterium]
MRRLAVAALLSAVTACLFAPRLEERGYKTCTSDAECAEAGRLCRTGYCSPPTWWNESWGERRQVVLHNVSGAVVPKGFPARLGVGPDPRPFKRDEFNPSARLVAIDRTAGGAQVEVPVTVDVLSSQAFDVIFRLPAEIPVDGVYADLFVYSAAGGAATRTDARKDVYDLDDDFEALTLDAALWRSQGPAVVQDGDAVVQRDGYLWSNGALPATPGALLTVEFQVDSNCDGLAMGLISNSQRGFKTPYVVVSSTGPGQASVQALRGDALPFEPDAPAIMDFTGSTQRLDLLLSGAAVRVILDGNVVDSFEMREAVTAEMRAHFFVEGGNCTLSIHKTRMRAALADEPELTTERRVARPD